MYNSSTAVTTIDKQFYNIIKPRIKQEKSLHIIPNFVDTDLYVTESSTKLPAEFLSEPGLLICFMQVILDWLKNGTWF